MKFSVLCSATLWSLSALAFPAGLLNGDNVSDEMLAEITELAAKIQKQAETARAPGSEKRAAFDAGAQRVDTTGEHKFVAATSSDLRGPCPGLNALANHGYLPHNGLASVLQITQASNEVFGMGLDLSAFLAVYGAVMSGDITSLSIGGEPPAGLVGGLTGGLGLLGKPQGLSHSQQRFECDASPTRGDLFVTGDSDSVNLPIFEELMAQPLGPNGYDLSVLFPWRATRFHESISTNGHYFAGPVAHIAVNNAAFIFTYRFFANYTEEYPDGYLDAETLKSFEGVTGEKGSFKWSRGHERIPEFWYRRPIDRPYGIVDLNVDGLASLLATPELGVIGGNTGEPNTFVGVNLGDLTGGVFNAENLLEGNNLMCFALQVANVGSPDILKGLLGNALLAVQKLTSALDPLLKTLGCPQLAKYDKSLLQKFPGAGL